MHHLYATKHQYPISNPKPQTPNTKPQTVRVRPLTPSQTKPPNPKLQTSNPKPQSVGAKPQTLNPKPQTPNTKQGATDPSLLRKLRDTEEDNVALRQRLASALFRLDTHTSTTNASLSHSRSLSPLPPARLGLDPNPPPSASLQPHSQPLLQRSQPSLQQQKHPHNPYGSGPPERPFTERPGSRSPMRRSGDETPPSDPSLLQPSSAVSGLGFRAVSNPLTRNPKPET